EREPESRSRSIASPRATITIARVRAPNKGVLHETSLLVAKRETPPRHARRNDHSRAAKLTRSPLTARRWPIPPRRRAEMTRPPRRRAEMTPAETPGQAL